VENLLKDLRFGVRTLFRQRAFTAVAVLSLALGVGINTTIFSVVNAVLLRPLPIHEPDRLVEIYTSNVAEYPYLTTSYPDYLDIRDQTSALATTAAHGTVRGILTRDGHSELVSGEVVTDDSYELHGIQPVLGREFLPEENRTEGTHPVVVVSHGFWQRRLGGDPQLVGSTLRISGVDYSVVGVAPEGFNSTIPGLQTEFWAPVAMVEKLNFAGLQSQNPSPGDTRLERRGTRWLFVKGRLAEGRSFEEAQAQVQTVASRLAEQYPDVDGKLQAKLLPSTGVRLHPMVDGVLAPAAAVLLGAVGLVLLIACANVANMLLARAAGRRREIAVRLAIGASRGRLVRQLLTESLLLAALGGAVGIAVAWGGARLLTAYQPPLPIPLRFDYALDLRVLAFATFATLVTALAFGLAPALQASRPALVPALKNAEAQNDGRRRLAFRDVLVVGQLAVSLVLLVAGALLVRGLVKAHSIDPGFDPDRIATLSLNLKMMGYSAEQATPFQERLVEELQSLPGVEAVALASRLPLGSDINMEGILIPEIHESEDDSVAIDATWVDPDYFRALGVEIVAGRGIEKSDARGAPLVAVVNQAMAQRYWPDGAVGRRFYTEGWDGPVVEVAGVVRDYKVRSLGEEPRPYLHFAWAQQPTRSTTVMVRAASDAAPLIAPMRARVQQLDAGVVLTDEGTLTDLLQATLTPTRVGASLLGSFGVLALLLASVGLYGVVAYAVSQRTRELGVRMALGARRADVVRMVLLGGLRMAGWGIGIGVVAAAVAAQLLSSLLYGLSSFDSVAFGAAAAVLLGVAMLANAVPAWRASRVDPMVALRYE
jgi:putative ABC transport system permease protein